MTPEEIEVIRERLKAMRAEAKRKLQEEAAANREPYAIIDPSSFVHVGQIIPVEHIEELARTLRGRLFIHRMVEGKPINDLVVTCPGCKEELADLLSWPVPGAELN